MPPARARPPAARFVAGTAFELLASLAAVAEPRWRSVLTDGDQLIGLARRERGPAWVRQVASAGRFGWINLMSLVLDGPRPHTAERSIARLAATDPELFHLAALGMRRRQLRALVSDDQAGAAIRRRPLRAPGGPAGGGLRPDGRVGQPLVARQHQ